MFSCRIRLWVTNGRKWMKADVIGQDKLGWHRRGISDIRVYLCQVNPCCPVCKHKKAVCSALFIHSERKEGRRGARGIRVEKCTRALRSPLLHSRMSSGSKDPRENSTESDYGITGPVSFTITVYGVKWSEISTTWWHCVLYYSA